MLGFKVVVCLIVFTALGLGAWHCWCFYSLLDDPLDDARFDRAVWLAARTNQSAHNPRGPMVVDLQQRFLHRGMTRRQVETVIGRPNGISKYGGSSGVDYYYLGYCGSFAVDPTSLQVHYDKRGRLTFTRALD